MILLIALTGFPPIFGYSTLLTLCGFIYGFPLGMVPAYIGAVAGATGCFLLGRKVFKDTARAFLMKNYPSMLHAIENAVQRGGLKVSIGAFMTNHDKAIDYDKTGSLSIWDCVINSFNNSDSIQNVHGCYSCICA